MSKELAKTMTEEQKAILDSSYPVEDSFSRILLPRLGMVSQDKLEEVKNAKTGKKEVKLVTEAGTFFIDREDTQATEMEEDAIVNGKVVKKKVNKKLWSKTEIGNEIEAIVLFERRQLSFYDGESYTSSPIYDTDDQEIPLFNKKQEVDRGTPAELKARPEYQGVSAKGKAISKLEDNKILYILKDGEVFQMSLRGTSMYAFKSYKKDIKPNQVLTRMNSEPKENGATKWNQMTFEAVRPTNADEASIVIEKVTEIVNAIKQEQAFYASKESKNDDGEAEQSFKALDTAKTIRAKRSTDM